MARIRSIKPEFFTDAALGECSSSARLTFIATWVFADDYGNLDRSAKQLKAQAFPYDSIDVEPLLAELIAAGCLVEYAVDEKKLLHIKGFEKHQRIDRKSAARFPVYEPSARTQRVLDEASRLNGVESNGKEVETLSGDGAPDAVGHTGKNGHDRMRTIELRKQAIEALNFLNEKAGRRFEPVEANIKPIVARLKEGSTLDDLRAVIAMKIRQWKGDEKMVEYLRPETLFRASKFASYKGQLGAPT